MRRAALTLAVAIVLAGCATAPPPVPVTPPLTAICIPLGNITPAQQKAAGDALAALSAPQQAALTPIVGDWIAMRAADRACLKGGHR